ncbi:aspartate/glutamate racemase family protein [Mucilaginibacter sabulilitoris]|uniref:Aspartate/glutamate racemase family protein n=1 Tax=Mucilaginibacter sabulilitoris TaxID=1173583 RepID=A0ABZ0TDG5_9SPHI|nr:aspartate/glutamate racemase family protein [Mucilaginibacter sabulilitoris]WPU91247.1 aspartate/glutamate racemase family protein [Mucilaginibacter sabulilitoris]
MKTLGLIGGISWVSTAEYYKLINEGINQQLGGLNFVQCIIYSFNYADIVRNNESNNWESTLNMITQASLNLKQSGAEAIVLCANTMHKIADELEQNIQLPVIHIATETAHEIERKGLKTVGLLGTKFTMEFDFFKDKLVQHGIKTLIPGDDDRKFIHHTIADELGKGIFKPETKARYLSIIDELVAAGAEGIILGCTEIPLLISSQDTLVTLFDTVLIHSNAAIKFALGN